MRMRVSHEPSRLSRDAARTLVLTIGGKFANHRHRMTLEEARHLLDTLTAAIAVAEECEKVKEAEVAKAK